MKNARSLEFAYADRFDAVADSLPGPFAAQRKDAVTRLKDGGLPSTRIEAWKYTSLNPLTGPNVVPAAAAELPASLKGALPEGDRLVFVNGRLDTALSTADAVAWSADPGSLGADFDGTLDGILADVNTAFMTDGAVLRVPADTVREAPLHLVFVTDGAEAETLPAQHTRSVVELAPGAKATVIETHLGVPGAAYWANPVVRIDVGTGAKLTHVKIQDESLAATHLALTDVQVAAGGRYNGLVVTRGAQLSRSEVRVSLNGEEANCRLNGVYLLSGRQHGDHTTRIDHAVAQCTSDEIYKGVLSGRAHGVFQGQILVRKDAQQTIGNQLNRTILLSPDAEMSTKPELEIFADDVKCSHGATTGELDDDEMFYLRSRGIPASEARRLLVRGFIAELLDDLDETTHDRVQAMVDAWLENEKSGDDQ